MSDGMENSEKFAPQVIERALRGQEGPFLDAKRELYRFNAGGKKDEILAMLIKHIIAFANIARRTGKACHMVFGVDDNGKGVQSLYDVKEQYIEKVRPNFWDDDTISIHKKQLDGVEAPLQARSRDWIEPLPNMRLRYGVYRNFFVSYLEILPEYPSTPYHLKKRLADWSEKTVFSRYGTSTVKIDPSEVHNLLPASQFAYIEPFQWRSYIQYLKSGEFLDGKERATFPIRVTDGSNAKERVIELLGKGAKSIAVVGPAGQGKTTLLQQLTCLLAEQHDLELPEFMSSLGEGAPILPDETTIGLETIEPGITQKIPFYMSLRHSFSTPERFDAVVCRQLREYFEHPNIRKSSQVFEIPRTRWIVFLDGVDEIRNRMPGSRFLEEWVEDLPGNVQVVIASRPYPFVNAQKTVVLDNLHPDDIRGIVQTKLAAKILEDELLIPNTVAFLEAHPDLYPVLGNLRGIEGMLTRLTPNPATLPAIDQPRVSVENPPISSSSQSVQVGGALPYITASDVEREDVALDSAADEGNDGKATTTILRLTDLLEGIFKHQRDQEVERQQEMGRDPKDLAEKAFHEARRLAWESDWESARFDYEDVKPRPKKRLLDWNRFIGFIVREEHPKYRFFAPLAAHYLAASFLYAKGIQHKGKILQTPPPLREPIVHLYNELCIQNGNHNQQIFLEGEKL